MWHKFIEAPELVTECFRDQIIPPRLGETRIRIGSLHEGIVLFHFENNKPDTPSDYMIVPRP